MKAVYVPAIPAVMQEVVPAIPAKVQWDLSPAQALMVAGLLANVPYSTLKVVGFDTGVCDQLAQAAKLGRTAWYRTMEPENENYRGRNFDQIEAAAKLV